MAFISRLMQQNCFRNMMLTATSPSAWRPLSRGRSSVASPLMRSILVLKNSPESLQRFREARADVYVLDLEDGVPKDEKESALKLYAEALQSGMFRGQTVYVRLSDITDDIIRREASAICHPDLTGFIAPKVASSDDIRKIDEVLSEVEKKKNLIAGPCKIMAIAETLEAVLHAPDIAKASPRMSALMIGRADIAACFQRPPLSGPIGTAFQLQIVHAAKMAGIAAIDGVTYLDNFPLLERDVTSGKNLGYEGMVLLHPSLVPFVNQLYTPTRREIEWAEQVTAGVKIYQRSHQESRQFIGPPHLVSATHILETHRKIQALESSVSINDRPFGTPDENSGTVIPLMRKGGLTGHSIKGGEWTPGIVPVTLDSTWRAAWDSSFLNARSVNSSDLAAKKMDLPGIQPPFQLLAILMVSLSVPKSSEVGRFHLGLFNAVQLRPVTEGESVRAYFSIDSVEDAGSSGKYSVVTSSHILVNEGDEVIFQAKKRTMYPKPTAAKLKLPKKRTSDEIPVVSELRRRIVQNAAFRGNRSNPPLVPNQLYIHRMVKVFSPTEVMGLATLLRVTNQHHYNVKKFNPEDILTIGALVETAMLQNVVDDFGDILYQEVVEASNVNRTPQEDMIGSISYIHSVRQLAENPDLEEVTVRTLGIKNLEMEEILEREVPVRLFSGTRMKTSDYEEICREDFPLLYRRIAAQVLWKFLRLRPQTASDEVPEEIQPKFS
ncbi:uncharacterized protein LOC144924911 [Branchiostoma floridae x Branchiostoma belcheri]